MSANSANSKPRGRFRWYQLYFALAAFDLITIGFSLYLNHRLLGLHAESVAVDQVWADRLNRFSELGRLVAKMGAPGDDVFASHRPAEEAARMKAAEAEVRAALAASQTELVQAVAAGEREMFQSMFGAVRTGIGRVAAKGALIFEAFEKGDRDKAGAHMAAMDRDLGLVDEELVKLGGAVRDIQSEGFHGQLKLAHSLQRFELAISLAVVVMIGAATIFGHKMASTMRTAEAAQSESLAAVQLARDQLERRVAERTEELTAANTSLLHEVAERKAAVAALEEAQAAIVDSARLAGMAEVATGVLHNVGNVLNSVNISASITMEKLRTSKVGSLAKAAAMIAAHAHDLGDFLGRDPQGQRLGPYLQRLSGYLLEENAAMCTEIEHLARNIEHIKEIVAMQQSYARVTGALEDVSPERLIEDALQINVESLARRGIDLVRELEPAPVVRVDKHKVLQILINLIRNAKHAVEDAHQSRPRISIAMSPMNGHVQIRVTDNGVGISQQNMAKVFRHGFTTKKNGHGFGLHSGALAAKEMGGALCASSDGPGMGATFTLTLPVATAPSLQ